MGRITTVVGVALSILAAYVAGHYNSLNDLLQLVFSFVNAPLFATNLLGMFWKGATGDGAFWGLIAGTTGAALTHGLTPYPAGQGRLGQLLHTFASPMAQNFWIAIFAWTICFLTTLAISLVTQPRAEKELEGLVYGLTKMPRNDGAKWYKRPVPVAILIGALVLILNLWFA